MRPLRTVLFLSAIIVSVHRPASAGGAIASGEVVAGTLSGPGYSESWTFTATAGDRVIMAAVTTGGAVNTYTILHPPVGPIEYQSANDRVDRQLAQTGTYTIEIQDLGLNDAGSYSLGFTNVTAGPHTNVGDLDGGAIVSADVVNGTTGAVADFDVFTFSGTNGDRVLFDFVATAGAGYNTMFFLYPPGGGAALISSFGDQVDAQLNASGTWSIVIEDVADDTAGSYSISLLNITSGPLTSISDPDGGAIVSGATQTGEFDQGVDFDAWTFAGTAGDRVIVLGLATGAGSHNTTISVFPPDGGTSVYNSANDRFDISLGQTGTYTLVISDSGLDHTGTYTIAHLNVTAGPHTNGGDLDGGAIASGDVTGGTTDALADFDAFTFTGTNGDRVVIDCVATTALPYNTVFYLYGPAGATALTLSFGDQIDAQLNATGTWTIVVEDVGDDTAGSYAMSLLNVTSGPLTTVADPDGGAIVSGEIKSGQFNQGVDLDAWTFSGTAGDRVIVAAIAVGAGGHNTNVYVFPPNGATSVYSSANDRFDLSLAQTGTYTLVIEDMSFDNTGSYTLGLLNVTAGPHTSGSDVDGAPIASGEVTSGTTGAYADFDAFTFTGANGDRVLVDCVATAGAGYNTTIYLYPPAGGAILTLTFGDLIDAQLNASGTWTIVVEDTGDDTAGSYSLSFLNVTSGPFTTGPDPDGGAIVSNQIKTGQFQQGVDFDAWQFTGVLDARVLIAAVATGGGGHNTQIYLYPPGGGPAVQTNANDRTDYKLTASGTYTIVVQDQGYDNSGAYTLSYLDVSNGPYTDGADGNGGAMVSNQIVSGTASGVADFDGFTFAGTSGDRLAIGGVATGGAGYNTTLYLYPPGGGAAAVSTFGDRMEFKLNQTGTWTIVIEDNANDTPGNYNLCVLDVTAGPYWSSADNDGGGIILDTPTPGTSVAASDFDGFTFVAGGGQTVSINAVVTSGAMNTFVTLYPPLGESSILSTATDASVLPLTVSGTYTVVIEDQGQDQTGMYTLTVSLSGVVSGAGDAPGTGLALLPAYPSPFNDATRLDFTLPAASLVRLRVYDVRGALVRDLVDENRGPGLHTVAWDGRDERGGRAASGVYYVQLETGAKALRQKIVLVR